LACGALLRGSRRSSLAGSQFAILSASIYRFTRIANWQLLKLPDLNLLMNLPFLPI